MLQPKKISMKRRFDPSPLTSSIVDQLPIEVLRSIFNKLSFPDFVQAKAVCSSWNLLGEEFVSKMPWLMLPSKKEVEEGDGIDVKNNGYNGFLNLGENRVYSLKTTPMEFRESCCIGSSQGWLVFLGQRAVPFLLNPFRRIKIHVPPVDRILGLKKMERNMDGDYEVDYFNDCRSSGFLFMCGKQEVRERFIQKAILTGEPDSNNENYGLILLCNYGKEIVYYASGGDNSWTILDGSHPTYQDIICHENNLYALSDENSIEVWDLRGADGIGIAKRSDIVLPFPEKLVAKADSLRGLCTTRFYLVEACGDLLLVVRFIGDYVDGDGTLLQEWDCLADLCNHPKVCPYRTFLFHVYKLDSDILEWVEMDSLGDQALFIGGNESVSISARSFPNCEKNSVYFTDDNWGHMEEDYLYGGHDMGIYNMKDGSVKPIYEFSSEQIQPPPCWIIPPAMLES
ncbi:hypothetical protein V6N13_077395 [Hibiscus sabdariffa]|uniref:F-box domain-containing protein n=1 Tax=Hibiscus sabdariffa TaxID=183260 RepID=A0ABR2CP07_9ROSI